MKSLIIVLIVVQFLASCRGEDFYEITKVISAPDYIYLDKEFVFDLILRNDSLREMKLTIDYNVLKSVFFNVDFYCDNLLLLDDVENPKSEKHNYREYYLKKGDKLKYSFKAKLSKFNVDSSLQLVIYGYERIYRLKKPNCKMFKMNFAGMWIPGDFNPADSMEGYNFGKEIIIMDHDFRY